MHTIRPRRRTAAFAFASALVAVTGFAAAPAGAAAKSSTSSPAAVAAGWLGRQFTSSGDLPSAAGDPGLDYVPLAIVALASARVGSKQINKGIGYLEHHFQSFVEIPTSKTSTVADPGRLAEVILAAEAAKVNPRRFGGDKAVNDLVTRLLATQSTSGTYKGLFGSPKSPTYATAYTQGLVLTALAAAGQPNTAGAQWLVAQQCSDGGWEGVRSVGTACPKPDPKTNTGPDTNDTALAIEGLVATKMSPKVNPISFLKGSQYPTGGFAIYGGTSSFQAPDPDSTAVVAQALVALGDLSSVTKDGKTVERGLARYHLGCGAPSSERGAYRYPGESGVSLYATIQAIPAASRRAFPISPGTTSSALPTMSCT